MRLMAHHYCRYQAPTPTTQKSGKKSVRAQFLLLIPQNREYHLQQIKAITFENEHEYLNAGVPGLRLLLVVLY